MLILEEVQKLYPEFNIIHGPYSRIDNRKHVVLYNNRTFKKKTISYPKLLLELKIGRVLILDETCDHIDGNLTNDSLDNLRVLDRPKNSSVKKATLVEFTCKVCYKVFTRRKAYVLSEQARNHEIKYCSSGCSHRGKRLGK